MENIDSVIGARYMMRVHMRLQRSDGKRVTAEMKDE